MAADRPAEEAPALRDDHGGAWAFPPLGGRALAWIVMLPGAFTPVCTGELPWIAEMAVELAPQGVGVHVVACDAAPVLRRVREDLGLPEELVLLSDFWPHGAACRAFDAFDAGSGRARRVSVLVDASGAELARVVAAPGEARSRAEHDAVLAAARR